MPLMGSLYVGSSGLQTSQNALNTTAHNLSNIESTGYVRQQVQQGSKSYVTLSIDTKSINNKQYGLGVSYSRVKQVRDYFIDKTYRRESGRSMFYEVTSEALDEVESQLGEMNGEAFQSTIEDFWTSIQELSKEPANGVNQALFVQSAEEFILRASAVYDALSSYQDNLNVQIKQQIDKINNYGKQIVALNESIRGIESGRIEQANDLRDSRNQILDELAEMANINYGEDIFGNVWVQIEGVDFVKGDSCYQMDIDVAEETGFYTPVWPQNYGAPVFNLSRTISTDLNTDIGGLKSMLLARGDHRADYTDIVDYENADGDIVNDYDSISQSIVMNVQAEFDQLIHNIAVKVNEIIAKAAGAVTATVNGTTTATYCPVDSPDGYMRNADGSPIQVFAKISTDGWTKTTLTAADNVVDEEGNVLVGDYWVYNEENLTDPSQANTVYTLKNIQVSNELSQSPSMLGFRLSDGKEDKATTEALKKAFTEEEYTLNPNVQKRTNFENYYSDLVAQISNTGYVNKKIYANQQGTVESLESARQQVIGVSSDEELSNMVRFQNAYNAASRYINVVDEMLEHILNTLGT